MNLLLYVDIAVAIAAGTSFFIYIPRYFDLKRPLYASMIVMGVGCIALGRIYRLTRLLTGLTVTGIFNIGILGAIGCFAFFFSSNFGQLDSVVDDGSRLFLKYRLYALFAPLLIFLIFMPVLASSVSDIEKLGYAMTMLSAACAAYFHLKHLLIPDVDFGIIRCQRGFNALALIFCVLTTVETAACSYMINELLFAACVLQCAVLLAMLPVLDRGVRLWNK